MTDAVRLLVDGEVRATNAGSSIDPTRTLSLVSGPTPPEWRWNTRNGLQRPLPPYDLATTDWTNTTALAGVDVSYAFTLTRHLFGEPTVRVTITDGRPERVEFGDRELRDGTDVWVEFDAVRGLRRRLEEITPVEVLAPPSDLGGEIDAAMLVAGLVDVEWARALDHDPEDLRDLLAAYRLLDGATL